MSRARDYRIVQFELYENPRSASWNDGQGKPVVGVVLGMAVIEWLPGPAQQFRYIVADTTTATSTDLLETWKVRMATQAHP